jgi:NAD+ synthetase
MKIAIAQVNTTVGDLAGNLSRCVEAVNRTAALNPDLILFPEMTVPGYPPRDILLDETFVQAVQAATFDLARQLDGFPPTIVGSLAPAGTTLPRHPNLHNAVYLLSGGEAHLAAVKRLLPVYDVFHEPRWFVPGRFMPPVEIAGKRVGMLICEDLWSDGYPIDPAQELLDAGAEVLVNLSASPYRPGVLDERIKLGRRLGVPFVFANLVGATDELIFDGRGFALDAKGILLGQCPAFEEAVRVFDLDAAPSAPENRDEPEELFRALALGLRDFAHKNRLKRVTLGLSGGVDSSLAAVLAAEALGPEAVTGIAIPSRYSDPRSTESAEVLAKNLGIGFQVIPLEPLHAAAESSLGDLLDSQTGAENAQARLRMLILMAFVNKHGGFLLNTSNKTELSLGYATLYGDMAGALAPLGDLTKPQVYALARWINRQSEIIPPFCLERPPSAELRPGQIDPFDYEAVAPAMDELVRLNQSDPALRRSEHKRWQMGIVLKVSEKSFGTGRLTPVSRK